MNGIVETGRARGTRAKCPAIPDESFAAVPTVVAANAHAIDLLASTLTYVADPELAGRRIKAPSPWVTQTPRVDFGAAIGLDVVIRRAKRTGERVVGRDLVRCTGRIDI